MINSPTIYYSNGHFLVYKKEDALFLRTNRIVGQMIGCCPKNPHQIATSSFPYLLNHYAVSTILSRKLLVRFKTFKLKENTLVLENELKFTDKISQLKLVSESEFVNKRLEELKKRNIEPDPQKIGKFDETKLKLTINEEPDVNCSCYDLIIMSELEVKNRLEVHEEKLFVYLDLYDKGFYISSGMKFGSDFLAYFGDPVRYHAQYAVRVIQSKNDQISLTDLNCNELNALNRLCHTTIKVVLLATVYKDINNFPKIKYWTIKPRESIEQNSDNGIFRSIEPSISFTNLTSTKRHFSSSELVASDEQVNKFVKL